MSQKKRVFTDTEKSKSNWVAVKSKTHPNRIYYYNKVTKKSTWTNPKKETQEEINGGEPSHGKKRKLKKNKTNFPGLEEGGTSTIIINKGDKHVFKEGKSESCKGIEFGIRNTSKSSEGVTKSDSISSSSEINKNRSDSLVKVEKKESRIYGFEKVSIQSRIMKKRKEFKTYADKLVGLINKQDFGSLIMRGKTSECENNLVKKNSLKTISFEAVATETGKIKDIEMNNVQKEKEFPKVEVQNNGVIRNTLNKSDSMFDLEEMDWEPTQQEDLIEQIKSMRKNLGTADKLSENIEIYNTDIQLNKSGLIMIFDTNIFISCLSFVKGILETFIPGFQLPTIFIPWRVLQELDHLKFSEKIQVKMSAGKAIKFINQLFSSRHPRISGQSFQDFNLMVKNQCLSPDDEILTVCINLTKKDVSRSVILITNDRNLESKAFMSHIEVYSKEGFIRQKLGKAEMKAIESQNFESNHLKDNLKYIKLGLILKYVLEKVLEVELRNAFGNDWIKIVSIKPPWTLKDILQCFIKHWRSVFTFVMPKDVLKLIEDLKQYSMKFERENDSVVIVNLFNAGKELLKSLNDVLVIKHSEYGELIGKTILDIEKLETEEIPSQQKPEADIKGDSSLPSDTLSTTESCDVVFEETVTPDKQIYGEKLKNFFEIIWNQMRNFCCTVSDLASSNGMCNMEAVNEVRFHFPNVMRNVQELVNMLEKIMSLGPEDLAQSKELIIHFTNFLVNLNLFQIESSELSKLPLYMSAFCSDYDGRLILSSLLNDLKHFTAEIVKGMSVLGFQ